MQEVDKGTGSLFGVDQRVGSTENEMSASMLFSPQFSRVLEQMNVVEAKVNNRVKKAANRCSTPSIKVTCFDDDDAYNENMLKRLEDPNWTELVQTSTAPSEAPATENLAAKENNEGENVCSDYSSSDDEAYCRNAASSGDENAVIENNHRARKKSQPSRKGFATSSQAPNRKITTRKVQNNGAETKEENVNKESANAGAADQLKTSIQKTSRRPSLGGSSESQRSDVMASPSGRRRRFTVSSISRENYGCNEPQNNSEHNNRKTSAPNQGQQVTKSCSPKSPETINNRKKSERIDLILKVDAKMNSTQTNQPKKRPQTHGGLTQVEKNSHTTDENLSSNEVFRTSDDDLRFGNGSSPATAGSPIKSPRECFQPEESIHSSRISDNSLSILQDAGVIPNSDKRNVIRSPAPTRRISTSMIQGTNSTSLRSRENLGRALSRSQSDLRSQTEADISQHLNLASPPQARKLSGPNPPAGEKPTQLGVRENRSLSKSETDLRKLVSEEEDAEVGMRVSVPISPRVRKLSSSLGINGRPSLSKSESDLGKAVSDEEGIDKRRLRSLSTHSPRMLRRSSGSQPQPASEIGASPCPLSPREERKIYLAAAKIDARLPIRAKNRNDLQASSQIIIDQAEKELDKLSERLPHISMEQVMKSWHTDRRHWNVVSTVVNPHGDGIGSKTNMEAVKGCRYIRESVVTKTKKHSQ